MERFCSVDVPHGEDSSLLYYREKERGQMPINMDNAWQVLSDLLCHTLAGNCSCQTSAAMHLFKVRDNEVDHRKEYPCQLQFLPAFLHLCKFLNYYLKEKKNPTQQNPK